MGLAHAGRAQKDQVLGPLHKGTPGEFLHLLAAHARLEGEVELLQALLLGEPGQAKQSVRRPPIGGFGLGHQDLLQELGVGELPSDRLLCLFLIFVPSTTAKKSASAPM